MSENRRDEAREAVFAYLMRAGHFRPNPSGIRLAYAAADAIILTVRYPHLRWDLDYDHETDEHRAIRASLSNPTAFG